MGNPSLLFKGQMIRAIRNARPGVWPAEAIDGSRPYKWQTRRVVSLQPPGNLVWGGWIVSTTGDDSKVGAATWCDDINNVGVTRVEHAVKCPYGRAGDVAWVRETWATLAQWDSVKPSDFPTNGVPIYYVDDDFGGYKKRPSIFMPRWASRDDLLIKWVRVERLRDISEADAKAEGVVAWTDMFGDTAYRAEFSLLWDGINRDPKKRKTNPYTGEKEECYVSYPWADEQGEEMCRGLTHYVIGNPWLWAIAFMRMARGNNDGG